MASSPRSCPTPNCSTARSPSPNGSSATRRAPRPRLRAAFHRLRRPRRLHRRPRRKGSGVAQVIVVYWRDIPAQGIAKAGRKTAKVQLSERVEKASDHAGHIGRGAGRERECQTGEVPVVAGLLKKKKIAKRY